MLSDVLSMYNGGDPLHHGTVEGLLEGGRERGGGGGGGGRRGGRKGRKTNSLLKTMDNTVLPWI